MQLSVIEEESKRGPETMYDRQSTLNFNMISSRPFKEDFIARQVSHGLQLEDFMDVNSIESKGFKRNSAPLEAENI